MPVVFGAVSTSGILDRPDVVIPGDIPVESTAYSLLVKTADFPSTPQSGDDITVDGVAYKVNSFSQIDDGKLARIGMSKV